MKIDNYHFEPIPKKINSQQLFELKRQILQSIPFLQKNLERMVTYLKKESNLNNFIEIDLPFFDSNISFRIFMFKEKIVISVISYNDSDHLGHLIINDPNYLDIENIKKLETKIH